MGRIEELVKMYQQTDIKEIIRRYEEEEELHAIAKELDLDVGKLTSMISTYYKRNNIENPVKKARKERRQKVIEDIEIIYERLKSGEVQRSIADEYKVSVDIISEIVLKYCVKNNKSRIKKKSPKTKLTQQDRQEIMEQYTKGKANIKELADRYNVVPSTIARYLPNTEEKNNQINESVKNKENKENKDDKKDNESQKSLISRVIEMYESEKSLQHIKNTLNIKYEDIRMILMNYMDIKNGKSSKKSMEILEKLGYDFDLIKKVAQNKNIEDENKNIKLSEEDEMQL